MSVDYREQYRPDQLEPFFPNEIAKMLVVVLCTLAVIMFLVVLPVVLDYAGFGGALHTEEPADPHGPTPVGIKPEWYFLGTYQYLRLMPTEFLGISGKTWGVLSQGPVMLALVAVPFWYRRRAAQRPGWIYRAVITLAIAGFLCLTFWGGWPEVHTKEGEQMAPLSEYVRHRPLFFMLTGAALIVFFLLMRQEARAVRRVLGDSPPPSPTPHKDSQP